MTKTRVRRSLDERIKAAKDHLESLIQKKAEKEAAEAEKARRKAERKKTYSDPDAAKVLLTERRRTEGALKTMNDNGLGDSDAAKTLSARLDDIAEELATLEE